MLPLASGTELLLLLHPTELELWPRLWLSCTAFALLLEGCPGGLCRSNVPVHTETQNIHTHTAWVIAPLINIKLAPADMWVPDAAFPA